MRKIVKFGGSSLASAAQFEKVGAIIRSDASRIFVVPSAPGKRFSGDTKVTDMLYGCYAKAEAGEDFSAELAAIKARYQEIIDGLKLNVSLDEDFEIIRRNFADKIGVDYAASRGEFLNGKLMAEYLQYPFVDSAEVIFFNENGTLNSEKTYDILGKRLKELGKAVVPGFYGTGFDGKVKTFSRGGSDVTGSIVARAAEVDLYENWTDVSGFLVTDPRIVDGALPIDVITYSELRELSYMGATVLHEDAVFPLREKNIPLNIKNTNASMDPGTMIVGSTDKKPRFTITGIAGRKNFTAINIEKNMMNSEIGFIAKVLNIFADHGVSIEHLPTGIDTLTVVVATADFESEKDAILKEIQEAVNPDTVEVENDMALIAVVGRGMRQNRGTAARIFAGFAHAHINVRMIDQGSSELNIIVGINNEDFDAATKAVYNIFIDSAL